MSNSVLSNSVLIPAKYLQRQSHMVARYFHKTLFQLLIFYISHSLYLRLLYSRCKCGGTCTLCPSCALNGGNPYVCQCAGTFGGANCDQLDCPAGMMDSEQSIDADVCTRKCTPIENSNPCDSGPCMHGGICTQKSVSILVRLFDFLLVDRDVSILVRLFDFCGLCTGT